jgi:hypothetical protein
MSAPMFQSRLQWGVFLLLFGQILGGSFYPEPCSIPYYGACAVWTTDWGRSRAVHKENEVPVPLGLGIET